jgi:hypothetical protein
MCKQAILPSIPEHTDPKAVWKFAVALQPRLNNGNPHSFGLAAVGPDNNLGVYKWARPKDAFRVPDAPTGPLARYKAALDCADTHYGQSGARLLGKQVCAMLLHARYATSAQGLTNGHPHMDTSRADKATICLVHNGVVRSNLPLTHSQCDSEYLVSAYCEASADVTPSAVQDAIEHIQGYFAYGALVHDGNAWTCDIVRDDRAKLAACYVKELGAVVFTTDADDVRGVCKQLRWKAPDVAPMADWQHLRISVATGDVLHHATLIPPKVEVSSYSQWRGDSYLGVETAEIQTALAGGKVQ